MEGRVVVAVDPGGVRLGADGRLQVEVVVVVVVVVPLNKILQNRLKFRHYFKYENSIS